MKADYAEWQGAGRGRAALPVPSGDLDFCFRTGDTGRVLPVRLTDRIFAASAACWTGVAGGCDALLGRDTRPRDTPAGSIAWSGDYPSLEAGLSATSATPQRGLET